MAAISEHIDEIYRGIELPGEPINELEFRLGNYFRSGDRHNFYPNVGLGTFSKVVNSYRASHRMDASSLLTVNMAEDYRLRITDDSQQQTRIREFCINERIGSGVDVYKKIRVDDTDFSLSYPVRVSYSSETQSDRTRAQALLQDGTKKTYRHAQRYTFVCGDVVVDDRIYRIALDCTVVHSADGKSLRESKIMSPAIRHEDRYEIELEVSRPDMSDIVAKDLDSEILSSIVKRELRRVLLIVYGSITLSRTGDILQQVGNYIDLCRRHLGIRPTEIDDLTTQSMIKLEQYFVGANIDVLRREEIKDSRLLARPGSGSGLAPYCVTDKADGTRALLYIDKSGNGLMFVLDTASVKEGNETRLRRTVRVIPTGIEGAKPNSLYDGEFLLIRNIPTYLMFDALVVGDQPTYGLPFWSEDKMQPSRKRLVDGVYKEDGGRFSPDIKSDVLFVRPKSFYEYVIDADNDKSRIFTDFLSCIKERADKSLHYETANISYPLDGLIFQECKDTYPISREGRGANWPNTKKWKPMHNITIDFRLLADKPVVKDGQVLGLPAGKYMEFLPTFGERDDGTHRKCTYMCYVPLSNGVPRSESDEVVRAGAIVECRFRTNKSGGFSWVAVKVRSDKAHPNGGKVYDSNMSLIMDPITLDMLGRRGGRAGGSDYLRGANTFNRKISSEMITMACRLFRRAQVLDLACGTGQSLEAMVYGGVYSYVGVDVRSDVKEASTRHLLYIAGKREVNKDLTARFYRESFTNQLELSDDTELSGEVRAMERFNVVVCNFAIHYAFSSEQSSQTFLYNVLRNLALNGIFVGVYLDWETVKPYLASVKIHHDSERGIIRTVKSTDGRMGLEAVMKGGRDGRDGRIVWALTDNGDNSYDAMVAGLYEGQPSKEYKITKGFFNHPAFNGSNEEYHGKLVSEVDINRLPDEAYRNLLGRTELNPIDKTWLSFHRIFMLKKTSRTDYASILREEEPAAPAPKAATAAAPVSKAAAPVPKAAAATAAAPVPKAAAPVPKAATSAAAAPVPTADVVDEPAAKAKPKPKMTDIFTGKPVEPAAGVGPRKVLVIRKK
jgi:SAM-dependent methyltransferase